MPASNRIYQSDYDKYSALWHGKKLDTSTMTEAKNIIHEFDVGSGMEALRKAREFCEAIGINSFGNARILTLGDDFLDLVNFVVHLSNSYKLGKKDIVSITSKLSSPFFELSKVDLEIMRENLGYDESSFGEFIASELCTKFTGKTQYELKKYLTYAITERRLHGAKSTARDPKAPLTDSDQAIRMALQLNIKNFRNIVRKMPKILDTDMDSLKSLQENAGLADMAALGKVIYCFPTILMPDGILQFNSLVDKFQTYFGIKPFLSKSHPSILSFDFEKTVIPRFYYAGSISTPPNKPFLDDIGQMPWLLGGTMPSYILSLKHLGLPADKRNFIKFKEEVSLRLSNPKAHGPFESFNVIKPSKPFVRNRFKDIYRH